MDMPSGRDFSNQDQDNSEYECCKDGGCPVNFDKQKIKRVLTLPICQGFDP